MTSETRLVVYLVYAHESFAPVPYGMIIPELDVVIAEVEIKSE